MTEFVNALRAGVFVTPHRVTAWAVSLLVGFVAALVFLFATAHGLNDFKGRPLGTDFSNVYAAGTNVDHGQAVAPFNPVRQYAREQAIFGKTTPFYGWHYPPFLLMVAAPLAWLPYIPALLVWQLATLGLYLMALWALLKAGPAPELAENFRWVLLAVAFPAAFVNLIHGHTGFLTAALLAGGLACLDERPAISGLLFGLLVYKPQFVLVVPLVLVAASRWRTLATMVLTVVALVCLVIALFGTEAWSAFFASTEFTRSYVLEQGNTGFHKIQSVFAWVRMWGGPVALAYALQGTVAAGAIAFATIVWRGPSSLADKTAALGLSLFLATPYCLDYDFVALAPVIALLTVRGMAQGFRPFEQSLLAVIWLVPIAARSVAAVTHVPIGILSVICLEICLAHWTFGDGRNSNSTSGQRNGVYSNA